MNGFKSGCESWEAEELKYSVTSFTDISKQVTLSLPAKHIFIYQREYGPINDTLDLMKPTQKGIHMNCLAYQHHNILINEKSTGDQCPIYELLFDIHLKHACMHACKHR